MEQKAKGNKWVMFILAALLALTVCITLLAPAPLVTTIMKETGWDAGATGGLISIISLICGIFVFVGSPLMDKLGVKMTGVISMLICAVGGILAFFAGDQYTLHYVGRILFGVGYGMSLNIPAVVIPIWFPAKMQPVMQGVRTALSYLGLTLAYYIILPIYSASGSWQSTLGIFGIVAAAVAVLFLLFFRNSPVETPKPAQDAPKQKGQSGLAQAAKSKEVWLLWLAMLCCLWAFNTFNSYLPTYLELEKGMSVAEASSIAGTMPIAGLVAGVVGGVLSTALGRRKAFGWPMFSLCIIGTLLTVLTSGILMNIGILLFGFGISAWTIMYSTVPAELPGSNPAFYGGAMAIIIGGAYIPCYFIPNIFQALWKNGDGMSIGTIFLVFGIMLVIALIPTIIIKETGPKGKLAKQRAAAEASNTDA